jgi:hypothetical protein
MGCSAQGRTAISLPLTKLVCGSIARAYTTWHGVPKTPPRIQRLKYRCSSIRVHFDDILLLILEITTTMTHLFHTR